MWNTSQTKTCSFENKVSQDTPDGSCKFILVEMLSDDFQGILVILTQHDFISYIDNFILNLHRQTGEHASDNKVLSSAHVTEETRRGEVVAFWSKLWQPYHLRLSFNVNNKWWTLSKYAENIFRNKFLIRFEIIFDWLQVRGSKLWIGIITNYTQISGQK